jgi:hypothetical protein
MWTLLLFAGVASLMLAVMALAVQADDRLDRFG